MMNLSRLVYVSTASPALDRDASTVDVLMEGAEDGGPRPLYGVHELVLREDAVAGRTLFRLAESPGVLLVGDAAAFLDELTRVAPDIDPATVEDRARFGEWEDSDDPAPERVG